MDINEIKAMLNLLDDPDKRVYEHIREVLIGYGEEVIPTLELFWEKTPLGPVCQNRIEDIIHQIQFEDVQLKLQRWVEGGCENMLKGAILVARYQYPDLDEADIYKRIKQLEQDIWLEMTPNLTAFEKVRVINHILYDVHQFHGNKKNFHAPQNSFINNVLESKKGNPLTLSILYMHLAQSLDIPIVGINLPNHFVLAYKDNYNVLKTLGKEDENAILFYINTFSRGLILDKGEIESFLDQLKLDHKPQFFASCTHLDIMQRMLTNLINAYTKLGYPDKVEEVKTLLKLTLTPPKDSDLG